MVVSVDPMAIALDIQQLPASAGSRWAPSPEAVLPSEAGRLELVARRPWRGRDIALDPATGRLVVACAEEVVLAALPDLGAGRSLAAPDVRTLALVPGRRALCLARPGRLRVWALDRDRDLLRLRVSGSVALAVAPDGGRVALAGHVSRPRGTVAVWSVDQRRPTITDALPDARAVAWCGGDLLAVGGRGVDLVRLPGGPRRHVDLPDPDPVIALAGAPGTLVCCQASGGVYRLDPSSGRILGELDLPAGTGAPALATDGHTLAVGWADADGAAVTLVEVERGRRVATIPGARAAALAGPWLAVTGPAGTAVLRWDPDPRPAEGPYATWMSRWAPSGEGTHP